MEKWVKVCLITAIVFGVIGIVIVTLRGDFNVKDGHIFDTSLQEEYDFDVKEIKNIDASIKAGTLLVEESDKDNISVEVFYRNYSKRNIKVKQKGDTLDIDESYKVFFPTKFKDDSIKIVVYLPKNIKLEQVKLEANASTIDVEKLSIGDILEVECNVGEITLNNIEAGFVDVNCNVGDIDVDIMSMDGMKVGCNVGNIDVNINESISKFNYEIDANIGDVEINNKSYKEYSKNQEGDSTIDIECNVGDVKLYLDEE